MIKKIVIVLFTMFFMGCGSKPSESTRLSLSCPDTLVITDVERHFRVVHEGDASTLLVAISDSLKNASFAISGDSVVTFMRLFDSYFKGVYTEPAMYTDHDDDGDYGDDSVSSEDEPVQKVWSLHPTYTTVTDTSADIRIDNVRILSGQYFSTGGQCVHATLMEISTHQFTDKVHPYTPDYMPFALNETSWFIIQGKSDGAVAFSLIKTLSCFLNTVDVLEHETEQYKLILGYSLKDSIPVLAFESKVIRDSSVKRDLELYAIGHESRQILSIPLESTSKASQAPGSFKIAKSEDGNPGNITTYRSIIRDKDTVSNTIENYYWQGRIYAMKDRIELVSKK